MINFSYFGEARTCIAVMCLLIVSACGLTPPDARVQGSRSLTAEEYVSRYAGNSILFNMASDGSQSYREMYFSKDGTYQAVNLWNDVIGEGTWEINDSLGTANMNLSTASSGFLDGKAFQNPASFWTMYVYVLPDGTASVFSRSSQGAGTFTQPKPTPGFQNRARFNSIKRRVTKALGS